MNHKHPGAVCPLFVAVVVIPGFLAALPLLMGSATLLIAMLVLPVAWALAFADLLGLKFTVKGAARVAGMYLLATALCGVSVLAAFPVGLLASGYHDRSARCRDALREERLRIEQDRARGFMLEHRLRECSGDWDPSEILKFF